jgi:hypothetical protein
MMSVGSIYIGTTGRVFVRQKKRNEEICRFTDWGELIPSQEIVGDNYLLGASYNSTTNILTFTLVNGTILTVDMNDLVDPPSIMTADLPNALWVHNNGSGVLTDIRSVSANENNILDIGTDGGAYLNAVSLCALIQDCNLGVGFNYISGTNTLRLLDANNDVLSQVALNNTSLVNNNNGTFTFTNEVGTTTTIDFKRTIITNPEANVYVITDDNGNVVEIDTTNVVTTLTLVDCTLTYTNEAGTVVDLDLTTCIQDSQSLTTIEYSGGVITYTDEAGNETTLNIGVENFLANVDYDGVLNQLTFTLTNGTEFIVSLNDLVDTFAVNILDTATINMSISGTGPTIDPYIISGSVKISTDANNKLEAKADGLYVDTRIQSANDFINNSGVGTNLFPITYDHASGKFTLTQLSHSNLANLNSDDHTQYLLADGSRTGASSSLQAFTSGVITGIVRPATDSTTAFRIQDAAGSTSVLTVDTTNGRIGVNGAPGANRLSVKSAGGIDALLVRDSDGKVFWGSTSGFALGGGTYPLGILHDGISAAITNSIGDMQIRNTSAAGRLLFRTINTNRLLIDALSNGVSAITTNVIVTHTDSGTPATGFGTGINFLLKSSTTADQSAGRLIFKWDVADHATRSATGQLSAYYTTTEHTPVTWGANSGGALLSFYDVATPIARQTLPLGASSDDIVNALANLGLTKLS